MIRAPLGKLEITAHMFVPFCVALYLTFFGLSDQYLYPDTPSYLYFSELRSVGYPLFLASIRLFSDSFITISYVQIWLYALSVIAISLAVRRFSGSNWFAFIISIPLCLNPYSLSLHTRILPDSLISSFSLLLLACLIHTLFKARIRSLLGFGFFIGLIIATVPSGWPYLLLILFASPLIAQQYCCSRTKAFIVPLIAASFIIFLETTTFSALHPKIETSPLSTQLFAKVSLMETHDSSPYAENDPRTDIWNKIEHDLSYVKKIIWQAPSFATRSDFLARYENKLAVNFAEMQIKSASYTLQKSNDDIRMDIVMARIIQDPISFLSIVFENYRMLWCVNIQDHPSDVDQVNQYRAQNHPYPFLDTALTSVSPNSLAFIQQSIFYCFWFLSFLTLCIGLFAFLSRAPFSIFFATSFLCALLVHTQSVWMAVSNVGHYELMLALSPLLLVGAICLLLGFYCAFISPLRSDH